MTYVTFSQIIHFPADDYNGNGFASGNNNNNGNSGFAAFNFKGNANGNSFNGDSGLNAANADFVVDNGVGSVGTLQQQLKTETHGESPFIDIIFFLKNPWSWSF